MAYANTQAVGSAASGSGTTASQAITLTSGRLAVAACEWNSVTATCSVADNLGNTWTPIAGSLATTSTGGFRCQLFWSIIATGGAASVTMTTSASTTSRLIDALEYSGGPASSPVEGANAANGTSSVPTVGYTTTNDHDLVIAHTVVASAAGGFTGAFATRLETNDNATADITDKTPAGAVTATAGASNSWWAASIAAFSLTAVGGTDATVTAVPAVAAGDAPAPSVSAGIAPVNTVAPAITNDSAHGGDSELAFDGETLTCGTGTWTGDATITYAFEWKTNSGNLVVSGTDTYVVDPGDFPFGAASDILVCTVTATNGVGSDAAGASTTPSYAGAPSADATVTALPAVAAGRSPAPTVSIGTNATVTAVPALSSGDSPAPTVTAGATVTAVPARSLGSAPAVNGLVSIVVTAPACVALGSSPVPTVGGAGDVSVTAVPAVSSGDSPAPTFQAGVSITAAVAVSAGSSPAPAVGFGATVTAIPALSAGQAPRPAVSPAPPGGGGTALVTATFAEDAA